MKFVVNSKQLFDKLQKLGRVINTKNPLPILKCFLFGVKGDKLYLVSSDMEARLTTSVDISGVEGDGKVALDAETVIGALKELPEQPITFDINDNNNEVFIYYQNGKYNFVGLDANEYPEPKQLAENIKQKLIIPAVDLHNIILGTLFATADDELRPVIEGIYFDITKDNTTFVASDGHKLVRLVSEIKGQDRASFILPKKGAKVLLDLLAKESEDIIINFDLNNANFKIGEYNANIRFIEGRYPNYDSVIPRDQPYSLELSRDILVSILKRVSVLGNKQSNLVAFDISNNALTVTAQDIDYSTASEESTEISYSGDPMKIGFKATYLIELLKNTSSDEINISLTDPTKAAIIMPVYNNSGFKQTSLLTPMVLSD